VAAAVDGLPEAGVLTAVKEPPVASDLVNVNSNEEKVLGINSIPACWYEVDSQTPFKSSLVDSAGGESSSPHEKASKLKLTKHTKLNMFLKLKVFIKLNFVF
jgi:hypothetical protein